MDMRERVARLKTATLANITASQIPRCMAHDDGRGRVVELRELCKQWAWASHSRRMEMIAEAPTFYRWHHRFTRRRHDLTRIAAVVHALCDRDDVAVPKWVWRHRSREHLDLCEGSSLASKECWRQGSPDACAYHRVWFDPASIEDHRVHGFTKVSTEDVAVEDVVGGDVAIEDFDVEASPTKGVRHSSTPTSFITRDVAGEASPTSEV